MRTYPTSATMTGLAGFATGMRGQDTRYGGLSRCLGDRVKISAPVSVTATVCSNWAGGGRAGGPAGQPAEAVAAEVAHHAHVLRLDVALDGGADVAGGAARLDRRDAAHQRLIGD